VLVPLVANQVVAAVSIHDQIDSILVLYIDFVSVEIAEHSKLSRMDYASCKLGLDWEKPMASEGLESPI
jgi:formaldehyde-activating enzyme involved in methanogenesis